MKKFVSASLAIAAIAGSLVAVAPAQANDTGAFIAGGVVGGLLGSAITASQPRPYYAPAPVYVEQPRCRWVREQYWDGYAYRPGRRVQVCD